MKIRNGFVSNSSSSSFIILGVKSNECLDDIEGIDTIYTECSDYNYINGVILIDEEYFEDVDEISFVKINEHIDKISKALSVDKSEIKLIYGCRPS